MGRLGKGQLPASQIHGNYVQQDGSVFTINGTDQKRYWNIVVPCAKPDEYITKEEFENLPFDEQGNYSVIQPDMKHDPDVDIGLYQFVKSRSFFSLSTKVEEFNGSSQYWYNYAYILHDKDTVTEQFYNGLTAERQKSYIVLPEEKTEGYPFARSSQKYALKRLHYHVVIAMENAKTFSKIRNWFGNDIHVEFVMNVHSSYLYLTHDTPDAVRRGKYRYNKSEIVCNNFDYFENFIQNNVSFEIFDPNLMGKYFFVDGADNALDIFMRFGVVQTQRWLTSINTFANLKHELLSESQGQKYCSFSIGDGLKFFDANEMFNELLDQDSNASSVKLLDCVRFSEYGEKYIYYKLLGQLDLTDIENVVLCNTRIDLAKRFEITLCPFGYKVFQQAGRLIQGELLGSESVG